MKHKMLKLVFKREDMENKEQSDALMALCTDTFIHPVGEYVIVYSIVDAALDTSIIESLPIQNVTFTGMQFDLLDSAMNHNLLIKNGEIKTTIPPETELPNGMG